MINQTATDAICKAEKIITDLFESDSADKETDEKLFEVMRYLSDARKAAVTQHDGSNIEVCDAVSGAMQNINKIRVIASRYSDAKFTDDNEEDENYIMFGLLFDLASEAHRRLKVANSELFK